jgi:transcriptional regulator with XRE-family HTH domain
VGQLRNNEFLIAFGKNLKKFRKEKGFTQEKLAFSIGVEISQISRIERGILNTSISTAEAIAKALEIPLKDLFDF